MIVEFVWICGLVGPDCLELYTRAFFPWRSCPMKAEGSLRTLERRERESGKATKVPQDRLPGD